MNEILIIGAGPAGLAMGGRLRIKGLNFDLVEKAENIASSWRSHYDRLRLHTVKKYSNLPHLPFPDNYPKFVSRDQLIAYLENYTERFNLNPQLGVEVNNIKRNGQKWSVTTNKGEKSYQKVIIATGVNRVPMSPAFKNEPAFKGEIIHSKSYKNPAPFLNKKVLIVGMGNTGAEIALDLCNSNVQTDISIRSKVNIVPLELFGRATQETAFTLNKLPRPIANTLSKLVQKIAIGNLSKYGIEKPDMSPIDQLSKTGKTPVIDLGTVAAIKSGKITIQKDIDSFTATGVKFIDGKEEDYDVVLLCTGYRARIGDFLENAETTLDANGNPKHCIGTGEWENIYFLGFDLFKTGGILGIINQESEQIMNHLTA